MRFDATMESVLGLMHELIAKENQHRAQFLEEYVELLPETFCPYLVRRIDEDITKPLEAFFKSDTSVRDLDEQVLTDIMSLKGPSDDKSYAPFQFKDAMEGYVDCLQNYDQIHKNILSIFASVKEPSSPERRQNSEKSKFRSIRMLNTYDLKLELETGKEINFIL